MKTSISILVFTFLISLNSFAQVEIDSSGNVGIGTITPGSKLDVLGVIKASGGNSNEWNSDADSTNELQQLSTSGDTVFISNGNFIIIPGLNYLSNTLCNTDGDGDGVGLCLDCNDADSTIYPGAPEICDFKDNDCDGLVDEDFPLLGQSCSTGLPGLCAAGTWQCQGGLMVCVSNSSSPEVCNGIDDDCDGIIPIDEIDSDQDGFSPCQGDCDDNSSNIHPGATEICDGLDNDCNGQIDEGDPLIGQSCNTGAPGICAAGTWQCQNGSLTCVQNSSPIAELCNNIDDDCDGQVDEGNPGGGASCNTGQLGVCATGVTQCQAGSIVCVQVNSPAAELCDGLDNDCDGQVDEGNPGGGASCNTGLLGVCAIGILQCQSGVLVCVPVNSPSAEICGDGLDNDCDGVVDEGCP